MKILKKIKEFGEALDFLGKGIMRMIEVGIALFIVYQVIVGNWDTTALILLFRIIKK